MSVFRPSLTRQWPFVGRERELEVIEALWAECDVGAVVLNGAPGAGAAADYPERAREAILEVHRQVGPLTIGPDGLARQGVLVRHLVMPGQEAEAAAIFEWLADSVSPDTYVNIMGQYRPEYRVAGADRYEDIDRRPLPAELEAARAAARRAGLWRFDQRVLSW